MERNSESDNDLSQAETLFEFAYKHVNSQYRRGRFLGCLFEDCKHTPGAKVPQPIGKRGQEYIYRVEDLAAAYIAVERNYQRTKLCAPRRVQRPDGLYCNIPALVLDLELDHHTVKDIVRKHNVRFGKTPGSRTLWHRQDAIAVVSQMRPALFEFDHDLNCPLIAVDRKDAALAPVPSPAARPADLEVLDHFDATFMLIFALAGLKVYKEHVAAPSKRTLFDTEMGTYLRYLDGIGKGARMQIVYPAGSKE